MQSKNTSDICDTVAMAKCNGLFLNLSKSYISSQPRKKKITQLHNFFVLYTYN